MLILFVSFFATATAQKGNKSISVRPVLSLPIVTNVLQQYYLTTGVVIDAIGQYNLSNRSSLLLQTSLVSYGTRGRYYNQIGIFSFKGGYKHQVSSSAFFGNVLFGIDRYSGDRFASGSFTLGAGKRIICKKGNFIDAGID